MTTDLYMDPLSCDCSRGRDAGKINAGQRSYLSTRLMHGYCSHGLDMTFTVHLSSIPALLVSLMSYATCKEEQYPKRLNSGMDGDVLILAAAYGLHDGHCASTPLSNEHLKSRHVVLLRNQGQVECVSCGVWSMRWNPWRSERTLRSCVGPWIWDIP